MMAGRMTGPFPLLFLSGVLLHGAYDAVRVLVSYKVIALGGGAAEVGVIAATFALVPVLLALRIGRRVDACGSRGAMVVGTVLSAAACAAIWASGSLAVLAAANAALGLGQVMTFLAGQGVVIENSPPERFVHGFALFALSVSVGQSIATPAVGVIAEVSRGPGGVVDAGPALAAMTAATVLALPLVLLLPRRARAAAGGAADAQSRDDGPRPGFGRLLRVGGMPAAIWSSVVVLTGIDLITSYMPVVGEAHGISPLVVSLLVATRSVLSMVSRAAMPALTRLASEPALLTAALGASTPAILLAAVTGELAALFASMAVVGFCWGMSQPLSMNWVATLVDARVCASALSLRLTGNRIGQVAVPLVAGALAGPLGPGSVFAVSAVLAGSATATTWRSRLSGGARS